MPWITLMEVAKKHASCLLPSLWPSGSQDGTVAPVCGMPLWSFCNYSTYRIAITNPTCTQQTQGTFGQRVSSQTPFSTMTNSLCPTPVIEKVWSFINDACLLALRTNISFYNCVLYKHPYCLTLHCLTLSRPALILCILIPHCVLTSQPQSTLKTPRNTKQQSTYHFSNSPLGREFEHVPF